MTLRVPRSSEARSPSRLFAPVTSEGSAESSSATNGNLLVAGSAEELAELLRQEGGEGWVPHGRVWDLDAECDPWGNLVVAYSVRVGAPSPLHAVQVTERSDGLYLFQRSSDAERFVAAVEASGGRSSTWHTAPIDERAAKLLVEAEAGE